MIFKGSRNFRNRRFWMIFGNFLSKTRIFLVNLLNIFLFGCLNFVFWTTWIFVTLTCIDPGYFTEGANERHRDHCGNLHFDCCCLSTCFCCLICAMKRYNNECFQRSINGSRYFRFFIYLQNARKNSMSLTEIVQKLVFNFK